jgi:hypothetical protein
VANVREMDGVDDSLFLNGGGVSLAGWGVMLLLRPLTLATTEAWMAAVDTPSTSLGVMYYEGDATVHELSLGSPAGDIFQQSFTLNTTDLWLVGFTKAAGTTAATFHVANITTGAAAAHTASTASMADQAGTWDQTEIGSGDGGTFFGNIRAGCAAVFTSVYSSANFDTVAAAKTTQAIRNLTPARMWDLNQASTATAVVNLMTGTADQVAIVGTTVVNDAAFDAWTFGVGAAAAPTMPPAFNPIPFMR